MLSEHCRDVLLYRDRGRGFLFSFKVAVWLFIAALAGGCAQLPHEGKDPWVRPLATSGQRAVISRDAREDFYSIFCDKYHQLAQRDMRGCSEWIAPLDVAIAPSLSSRQSVSRRPIKTVLIIPGVFGECFSRWVQPFASDLSALAARGYQVNIIPVRGRGSSKVNASVISDFMSQPGRDDVLVIAYSKGAQDFMRAASDRAGWLSKIVAFVTVAGVINGSPLADRNVNLFSHWLRYLPLPYCGPSDGGAIFSLTYSEALRVRAQYENEPRPYREYSITAIANPIDLNWLLAPFFRALESRDPRNDGQVMALDSIAPGSVFLGAFRADHWSIALPFEESRSILMRPFQSHNHFPRNALIESIVEFVDNIDGGERTKEESVQMTK